MPILIVGAGPAGATAAMRLTQLGLAVRVLDCARFPRDKICGDLLPPRTFELLRQAGFAPSWQPQLQRSPLLASGSVVFERLAQQRPSAWQRKGRGVVSCESIAQALPRRQFDALLVAQLQAAGVELLQGWQALGLASASDGRWLVSGNRLDRSGERWQLQTRWLLVADGAGSRLRRRLLGQHLALQPLGIGLRVLTPDPDPAQPSSLQYPEPGSLLYRWSFRLGPQRNQGLFWPLGLAGGGAPVAAPSQRARQWFGHCGRAWACPLLPPPQHLIGSPEPGVLLLGDAASLIDPLLGHGIDHAAESGLLAADCIAAAGAGGNCAQGSMQYDQRLRDLFRSRWQPLQSVIQRQLAQR